MKPARSLLFLLLSLLVGAAVAQGDAAPSGGVGDDDRYYLAAGDVIKVSVFGEPDLSPQERVNDRGIIPYPFLGDLRVRGLTPEEVEQLILDGLKGPYLVDPRVSVTIVEYRPVYMYGEVRSPGSYQWEPGMTIRKAVALAGGLADRASTRRIFLLPEDGDPEKDRARVSFDHPIRPGDIITIEQSFF